MTATMTERAPVEFRSALVADVHDFERIIDLVVVPYNQETVVEYPVGSGKLVTEEVLRGAFDGLDGRPGRVSVNRDHSYERTVGAARSFQTSREDGLIGSVKISATSLGDETLELAKDGVLSASVGMAVKRSDQRWSAGNTKRQIVRAFLDHIALLPNPSYVGAEVLAVRGRDETGELWTPPATPHLDEVLRYLETAQH